jgi:hypothetical protein
MDIDTKSLPCDRHVHSWRSFFEPRSSLIGEDEAIGFLELSSIHSTAPLIYRFLSPIYFPSLSISSHIQKNRLLPEK